MAERGEEDCDVIVVGAGLSGLTAAFQLKQTIPRCNVVIVEAKGRVGGRTLTVDMQGAHGTDSWDLGGQWVSSSQHHVLWIMEQLGIEHYPQFTEGKRLLKAGRGFEISEYHESIPALPLISLLDLHRCITNSNSYSTLVPNDEPWKSVIAEDLDKMTMEQLVESLSWTTVARDTMRSGLYTVNGARLREQSALSYIFYMSSAGSMTKLVESSKGSAQELRIKGGAQGLSQQLAERIGISNIILSEPVIDIDQSQPTKVKVHTLSGRTLSCKYVIVAAPPHCAGSIHYLPTPPVKRLKLLSRMQVGHLLKFIATYKKAFWREEGYSGELFCNDSISPIPGCERGPVQYVLDATTSEGSPALVGFVADPDQWGGLEFEVRKTAILNHLAEFLGPAAKHPIDFMEKDWALEPYNGGCPVSFMVPGALAYWDTIRTPHGRVHWAGTETATQWMGYLSGAVQSGLRAADEVLHQLKPETTPCSDERGSEYDTILATLDAKFAEPDDAPDGSLIWTLGKFAVGAAFVGFIMRRVWLAGGRVNLPWLSWL